MSQQTRPRVVLVILDGWGFREQREANAVALGNVPTWRGLWESLPRTLVNASGKFVGLPDGQIGNSEVGHLNLGAGRVVKQDLVRIGDSIKNGSFFRIRALIDACDRAKDATLHLVGLIGEGGVHAHDDHLVALSKLAAESGVKRLAIHGMLDGRDAPPRSGLGYMQKLLPRLAGNARFASIGGRYFGMDRDKRWERTQKWYDAAVRGTAPHARDAMQVIRDAYAREITDEFIEPVTLVDAHDKPIAPFADGDSVICWNFRSDRMRQIMTTLTDASFTGFPIEHRPAVSVTTMTRYDATFNVPLAFPPQNMANVLGTSIAQHGLKQYRTAETEKYAHVTYFFNGGVEPPEPGEDRVMVPSPKVATYDLQPEMSAAGVTDKLCPAIESGNYDFVLVNFANPDMVGHTGSLPAAIRAVEAVDVCLNRVLASAKKVGAKVIVTADHGNCETMVDPVTGQPHTAHTTNPVPLFIVNDDSPALRAGGSLCDVAPTVLGLLGVPQPAEMTGRDLRSL